MKEVKIKEKEESKLFFMETTKVIADRNIRLYYATLKNLLKFVADNSLKKVPDPK